jgi:homospermidine synthase
MVKITEFLMLGMGSIARSLMEVLKHEHSPFLKYKMTVICPEAIPDYIYKIKPDIKHIKKYITEDNYIKLLEPLISPAVFVVDLTVNTDSIAIMALCKKNDVLYINTSIEEYHKPRRPKDPEKLTLYYQDIQLEKEMKKIKNDTSQLHSFGLNPGACSSMVYLGIMAYCEKYHPEKVKLLKEGKYNRVARDVLEMIHIAEYDNQEIKQKPSKSTFYCSWSAEGYLSESLSPAFVASPIKPAGFKKSKYNKYMYYSPKLRSMDCMTTSICLDANGEPFPITGRQITHFELVSLSANLGLGKYVPKISYVYSSCPISQIGLENVKADNYREPENKKVFYQQDITNKDSIDSMGALLQFKDGRRWWVGSVLSNNQVMGILGRNCRSNATQLQVSAAVLAGIEWLMRHRHADTITAEEVPFNSIINRAKKYWGNFYCKEI